MTKSSIIYSNKRHEPGRSNCLGTMTEIVLALVLIMSLGSCIGDLEPGICEYNTRIVYRYDRENTAKENVIGDYIGSLDEYIYDSEGRLATLRRITEGFYASELQLPTGRYTVVTWGNITSKSAVMPPAGKGQTPADIWLYPANPTRSGDGKQDNGDRVYYGYRTFSVEENNTSRVYVDMEHAYCQLSLNIIWKDQTVGMNNGILYIAELSGVPSRTSFYPEYNFKDGIAAPYSQADERFPVIWDAGKCSYLPLVNGIQEPLVYSRSFTRTGDQGNVEFLTQRFRFRTDTEPLELAIYLPDGSLACKKIDLYKYFKELKYMLDTHRRQEFRITMQLENGRVVLSEINILDWTDGGNLDGWR